jgi:acyl carrier protein
MSPSRGTPGTTARRDEELVRIRERVAAVLSGILSRAAPGPDDDLDEMGVDSMARLDLLAALENEFHIELTEDLVAEFRTVNRIARIVRGALSLPAAASDGEGD